MRAPAVSVLIIVHDRAHTIGAAVRSVLAQTMADFELIVVDDGSHDATPEVVAAFHDPRIRLIRTLPNQGIPFARNRALVEARGTFVAWLDSDDLSHPDRLAVQRAHLERHPDLDMIGSAARKIRADGRLMKGGRVPFLRHQEIRALLLFRSAFQQSSIFGRTEAIRAVPYDPAFPVCEDVDMFARFTEDRRAENLPQFLIARRIHPDQTIRTNADRIIDRQMAISARGLARLGVDHDREELRRHVILGGSMGDEMSDALIDWAEGWFVRILAANARRSIYEDEALRAVIDLIIVKASMRGFGKVTSRIRRLASLVVRHPGGMLAMARDTALPLLPITSGPSAAALRPLLEA
jgi:glycosyltransferase involved in cell wall biosynthesis